MRLKDVASFLDGELAGGDPEAEITGAKGLEDAGAGHITFFSDRRLLDLASRTAASCVIVQELQPGIGAAQLKVKDPQLAFVRLLERFHPPAPRTPGVDQLAFVSPEARLSEGVSVQAFAFVSKGALLGKRTAIGAGAFIGEGSSLGDDCHIYPGVVILDGVRVGDRVVVHANSVIGSDGFGYIRRGGRNVKVPQTGGVVIGDDVEIGASVTIDRATTGDTVIGRGTKIDNMVQVAHNVKIGEDSIIVAQVAIGGSSTIGKSVTIAGQTGIADHAGIGDGTVVGARSGVIGRLEGGVYSGTPAIPHRVWLKASALFARLPELARRISVLEDKLSKLERGDEDDGRG